MAKALWPGRNKSAVVIIFNSFWNNRFRFNFSFFKVVGSREHMGLDLIMQWQG